MSGLFLIHDGRPGFARESYTYNCTCKCEWGDPTAFSIDTVAKRAASMFDVSVENVFGGGKLRPRAKASIPLCYWATHELGMTAVEPARLLNLDQSTISYAVQSGEHLS